jgi:hypothetical protein
MAGPAPATRDELDRRQFDLRRSRGAAVLDGKRFDSAPLAAVENALVALEDAEAEAARRAADSARKAANDRHTRFAALVTEAERARMAALGEAEKAALTLVASLGAAQRHRQRYAHRCA